MSSADKNNGAKKASMVKIIIKIKLLICFLWSYGLLTSPFLSSSSDAFTNPLALNKNPKKPTSPEEMIQVKNVDKSLASTMRNKDRKISMHQKTIERVDATAFDSSFIRDHIVKDGIICLRQVIIAKDENLGQERMHMVTNLKSVFCLPRDPRVNNIIEKNSVSAFCSNHTCDTCGHAGP